MGSMVGDGSIGSPSLHIRSFQLSQKSLSACWIRAVTAGQGFSVIGVRAVFRRRPLGEADFASL
jgi:hypothetical protein